MQSSHFAGNGQCGSGPLWPTAGMYRGGSAALARRGRGPSRAPARATFAVLLTSAGLRAGRKLGV